MTYKQQWRKMLKLKRHGYENHGLYFSKKYKNYTIELTPKDDKILINVVIDNNNWFRGFLGYVNPNCTTLNLSDVRLYAKIQYIDLTS